MTRPVRVYLDTNVFIAAYETTGARSEHAFWILSAVETGDIHGVTSELTLAELLPGPLQKGDRALAGAYGSLISSAPNFDVEPVTREVLMASGPLRVQRPGFKLPDAVHCATAMRANCSALITDDLRMPKNVGIKVVRFGPHALEDVRASRP